MFLNFKCLLVNLVSQYILVSDQIFLNNRFIGNDVLHRRGRRYFNLDFKFGSTVKSPQNQVNYRYYLKDNTGPSRKQNGIPRNIVNASISNVSTSEDTTPMIFVTLPSSNNPESSVPTALNSDVTTISAVESAVSAIETIPALAVETASEVETLPISVTPTAPGNETITATEELIFPSVEPLNVSIFETTASSVVETLTISDVKTSTVPTTSIVPVVESTTNVALNESSVAIVSTGNTDNSTRESDNITLLPTNTAVVETTTEPVEISIAPLMTGEGDEMTFPYSEATSQTGTNASQIAMQAKQDMKSMGAGYFTIFLLESTRIVAKKEPKDITRLLQALESEVVSLLASKKLSGFGKSTRAAFMRLVQAMNNLPPDVIQYEATLGNYLLMNRRESFGHEIVNLMDQTDSVLLEEEGERILHVLEDMDNYPNFNKTAGMIVHEMMDAVVIAPFMRVYGTATEVAIVEQLEDLIIKMVFSGYAIQRRKGANSPRLSVTKHSKNLKDRIILTTITNTKRKYKNRKKPNSGKETKRKLITIIVGTEKPNSISRKQKNVYSVKKAHKTRYRNIKSNRVKHTKKYKLIHLKLANIDTAKENKATDVLNTQTSKVIKDSKTPVNHLKKTKKFHRSKHKHLGRYNKDKKVSQRYKFIERTNNEDKDLKLHGFVANKLREESSLTDEEEKLKANLDDAFIHGSKELVFRNNEHLDGEFRTKYKFEVSSSSDEETILKSKIYKLLGYEQSFTKGRKRSG